MAERTKGHWLSSRRATGKSGQSQKLTRLKSPFGRLLHLFLVPECDFNLGYQSEEEVANDLEPDRKPITAFSRVVAEVEENIGERNGSCCIPNPI